MKKLLFIVLFFSSVICSAQERQKDTIRVLLLVIDTLNSYSKTINWQYGYSVKEKHSNDEGVYDAGFIAGWKRKEYWLHAYYLNEKKKPFSKNIIIWQSKEIK